MRTGSNFLETNLNMLAGVTSYGEVFNPHFIGTADKSELFGFGIAERDADPFAFLDRLRAATEGLAGFRFFDNHNPKVLDRLLNDASCAKIILTRNPLESYVSLKIVQQTEQWTLKNPRRLKSAKVRFDSTEFARFLIDGQSFHFHLTSTLQTAGQAAFHIDYEDLQSLPVLNGLAAFLGVTDRLASIDETLKKQNPGAVEDKVENPEEMTAALSEHDRFNVFWTPEFEPRRPPALPTFIAAQNAPLLYMPIYSGPVARIRSWLAAFDAGEVIEKFDRRSLRIWRRHNRTRRSFTVLRHPLLRAYVAFHDQIVSGKLSQHRKTMMRGYGADLPPPGRPFPDLAAERAAMMVFLHYARMGTSGQYGNFIDPNWMSQSNFLQSFAASSYPDLVIREDRLAEGLSYLAAETGVVAPPLPPEDAAIIASLDRIHDNDLEQAAIDAFKRDYVTFGFDRWKA